MSGTRAGGTVASDRLDHPQPQISVVVVTWNSARCVETLVAALRCQAEEITLDVTVVDNDSSDDTLGLLARFAPEIRVICNPDNRGLSAANNQGLLSTKGAFVAICNPDIQPAAGAFSALLACLQQHERAAISVPRITLHDGKPHVSVGSVPDVGRALLGRRVGRALSRGKGVRDQDLWWDDWPHDVQAAVPRGAESCYLVRRTAVAEVGLQDERFPLDWEGVDWASRFGELGWEIWFTPDATVIHEGGASIRQAQLHWVIQSHKGLRQYCLKRVSPPARPIVTVAVTVRAAIKAAMVLAGRDAYGGAQALMHDDG